MNRHSLLILFVLPACAEYNLGAPMDAGGEGAPSAYGGEEADADADADSDADADDTASESEDDYLRLAPAATDQYVFVANPDRDTVTRIAVSTPTSPRPATTTRWRVTPGPCAAGPQRPASGPVAALGR